MFNLGLLKWLLPMFGMMSFANGGEGGSGGEGGNGAGDGGSGEKVEVSKAEFEKIKADAEAASKLKDELEDMRLEVISPDYLEYLNNREKGGDDKRKKHEDPPPEIKDDEFEKMSKKDLFLKAKEAAKSEFKQELETVKNEYSSDKKAQTQREVAAFARTHDDFEQFRPVMYGLSLDPKNKDKSLQELYVAAKDHVKRIHTGTSEAEKEKQRKMSTEKPGGDNQSYERLKKLSSEEAAVEALEETKKTLGIDTFPSA